MKHDVGLDVAMEETAVCIVDDGRRIVREGRAASEPEAMAAFLSATGLTLERVGIEAGRLAPWLCDGLATAGLPVICIDARHMKAAVSALPVRTDRSDSPRPRVRDAGRLVPAGAPEAPGGETLRPLLSSRQMLLRTRIDLDDPTMTHFAEDSGHNSELGHGRAAIAVGRSAPPTEAGAGSGQPSRSSGSHYHRE